MQLALLFACAPKEEPEDAHCESYADEADAGSVLDWDSDCGTWRLALGGWVAVSVEVEDELTVCELDHDSALDPGEGVYTNMSNDVAKRTYQTYGMEPTGAEPSTLDIACDDGHDWGGRFIVE